MEGGLVDKLTYRPRATLVKGGEVEDSNPALSAPRTQPRGTLQHRHGNLLPKTHDPVAWLEHPQQQSKRPPPVKRQAMVSVAGDARVRVEAADDSDWPGTKWAGACRWYPPGFEVLPLTAIALIT